MRFNGKRLIALAVSAVYRPIAGGGGLLNIPGITDGGGDVSFCQRAGKLITAACGGSISANYLYSPQSG